MTELTTTAIRNLKAGTKPLKVFDGGGLFILVTHTGSRLWRWKYRFGGREKLLSLGAFPTIGLADARRARDEARALLAKGIDPSAAKRNRATAAAAAAEGTTFAAIATEYIEKMEAEGRSPSTIKKLRWHLSLVERDIGSLAVSDVTPPQVLSTLRRIEARGHFETTANAKELIGRVARYAMATGRGTIDPTTALRGALITPKVQHRPAITNARDFSGLLRSVWTFAGQPETRAALQVLSYLAVRPGEARLAEWSEFDFDAQVWSIPASRAKMRRPHFVPLPAQVTKILHDLREVSRQSRLVFPGIRTADRPISENTLNAALRRLGYSSDEVTAHGFRASFSTLANESGMWNPDAIERHLAHQEANAVRRAYARGEHWDERVKLATWWADYCDRLRADPEAKP